MKKFVCKVTLFATFCILFMTVIPISIDPYNVFHADQIRDNGIEPNSNYIKMNYILKNPDKFDAFIFGSSRVGSIHSENIEDVNCYNMTYSEGVPKEHLDNLKTFIANGIIPKRVYLGVDSFSYTVNPRAHYSDHSRISYEYSKENPIEFLSVYLDPYVALTSLKITSKHTPDFNYSKRFYDYGWWCEYGRESLINKDNAPIVLGEYDFTDDTIAYIEEFVSLCNDNNIELIVFTNPMHYINHYASWPTYKIFLEKLAGVTDFYNFSGLNQVTLNHNCYVDTSHYNAEIGDLMLEYMSGQIPNENLYEQGFGVYVTDQNIQELITLLEEQLETDR